VPYPLFGNVTLGCNTAKAAYCISITQDFSLESLQQEPEVHVNEELGYGANLKQLGGATHSNGKRKFRSKSAIF